MGFHEWNALTPLQLSARLGDQRMCKHILQKRLRTNWVWGPLANYSIHLESIDSAGEAMNSVLSIVAEFGATPSTQQMLLDDFFQVRRLHYLNW